MSSERWQEALPSALHVAVLGVALWQILLFALLILAALLASRLVHRLVVMELDRLARRAGLALAPDLLGHLRGPLTGLVIGLLFYFGGPALEPGPVVTALIGHVSRVVLLVSTILLVSRGIDLVGQVILARAALTPNRLDVQVVPLVRRAVKVGLWGVGLVFVVQNMGIDVAGLVAGLGIGGLAVALGAKDTIENFFGSITLFVDRPFQVGDWIVTDGGVEGVVLEIGFRSTRIRTFQDSVLSIPNGKLAGSVVDNLGLRRNRRVKTLLSLTYDTSPERIKAFVAAVERYLRQDPLVAKDAAVEVHLEAFNASSLDILVYYFLAVPDWHTELSERGRQYLAFLGIAEQVGVFFAFPSTSLYVERLPVELRAHPAGR